MKEKITACLVVRNEEKLIGRCLESFASVVDEIIVAHDGPCADQTLAIAEKFGAKIFILPERGDSDYHRPFVYGQAEGWILRLDADEFLSEDLKNNLRRLAEDPGVDCYEFIWPCWNGEKYLTKSWPHKACLFRREKISFLGIPNFVPIVSGKTAKVDYILEHRPAYDNYSWKSFRNKWLPRAKNQAECYRSNFAETAKLNYSSSSWPWPVRLRRKYPALVWLPDLIIGFGRTLFAGRGENILFRLRLAMLIGLFRVMVDYYILTSPNRRAVNFTK